MHFYPRSPCGERPFTRRTFAYVSYFYPRSPCGERPSSVKVSRSGSTISIHALLAESDNVSHFFKPNKRNFYPRSPCGERPRQAGQQQQHHNEFLSTLSLRRATSLSGSSRATVLVFLSTLSLRRATRQLLHGSESKGIFLSTLSLRRATLSASFLDIDYYISIHALLAESDLKQFVVGDVMGISIHALLAESD